MNLDELLLLREGWDFEAKLAGGRDGRGVLPGSLWETYSAMANTEGGLILLGAMECADGSLDLRGIADIDKVEGDLWNLLQNPQKVSANVLRREDVERVESDGRELLLLRVPKAPRGDRPVYLNGAWERGTYLRVHEGDRRVDREVARRMLADAIRDRDTGVVEDYTLDDLSTDSIRRYREFFSARRPDHPFLQHEDEGFLISIGAARRERGGARQLRPTWAGLWMLGDETAIREVLPHWHLSFMELPDDPGDPRRWLDRLHPDGLWNANLFEFYQRAIVKLHDGIKVPFEVTEGQYRVDETPVHLAVREALVNALVHADHQGTTGIRVIKRRAGFELVNPGLLLVTTEQVWRGGVSEPRNPTLQRLFGFLRLGEREGSGGPIMRRVWREQHWRAPRLLEDTEHNETHLKLTLESLLPDRAVRTLVERWGSRFTEQDELGRIILVTAEVEGSLNHVRVRDLSDVHPHDITLKLRKLVREGLLDSAGRTRGTTYQPRGFAELPLFAEGLAGSSAPNEDSSAPNEDSSAPNEDSSAPNEDSSALAQLQATRRAARPLIDAAIIEVCEGDYRTSQEIAQALGRSLRSVKDRYLPSLVEAGALALRYPDAPNHPAQAYRARCQTDGGNA